MSMISRIYAWSLVFESLIFFQILDQGSTGVVLNFGRAMQILVLLCLWPKGLMVIVTKKFNPFSPIYRNYVIFFGFAVFAGFVGLSTGGYHSSVQIDSAEYSLVDRIVNSNLVRPFFEYIIYLYYFIYFAILPQHLLKKERDIRYFFSIFTALFALSFAVGVVDLGLTIAGTGLYVPREMYGGLGVGSRFHGLAGEPRDAFVYLVFGLAMLHLRAYYKSKILSKTWVVAIGVAALMTQSASGFVGIGFFLAMYFIRLFTKAVTVKKLLAASVGGVAIIFAIYFLTINSTRMMIYVDNVIPLYRLLETDQGLPPLLIGQMPNIFPVYQMFLNLRDFNLLPVLFGSGLGSTSVINLTLGIRHIGNVVGDVGWEGVVNPHAQFIRVIYETGFVGLFFFYKSFLRPVEYLVKRVKEKEKKDMFFIMILLLLGVFFGHRSTTIYIYLGIFIAVFSLPKFQSYSRPIKIPLSPEPDVASAVGAH